MAMNMETVGVQEQGVQEHKWTRQEYEQIGAAGVFASDARLELIDGAIFTMTPQSSRHATAVHLVADMLRRVAPADIHVRIQSPLALGADSEPEPDVAVVNGSPRQYSESHPDTALLVVEVADSSLYHDQIRKRRLYAQHQISEYWIVDLTQDRIEVHQEPEDGEYRTARVLLADDVLTLPFAGQDDPVHSISVWELLP